MNFGVALLLTVVTLSVVSCQKKDDKNDGAAINSVMTDGAKSEEVGASNIGSTAIPATKPTIRQPKVTKRPVGKSPLNEIKKLVNYPSRSRKNSKLDKGEKSTSSPSAGIKSTENPQTTRQPSKTTTA